MSENRATKSGIARDVQQKVSHEIFCFFSLSEADDKHCQLFSDGKRTHFLVFSFRSRRSFMTEPAGEYSVADDCFACIALVSKLSEGSISSGVRTLFIGDKIVERTRIASWARGTFTR